MEGPGVFGAAAPAVSPSAERNKGPILAFLQQHLPGDAQGALLEVACGTGQHAAHLAPAYPAVQLQPTDATDDIFSSVAAHTRGAPNVAAPRLLDASRDWGLQLPALAASGLRAVLCINMTHISPWAATCGLMKGAGQHLQPGGQLFLYGPFKKDGAHTTQSNADFDASLRQRDPSWGYRDLADVQAEAAKHGLRCEACSEMPANNFMMAFRKGG